MTHLKIEYRLTEDKKSDLLVQNKNFSHFDIFDLAKSHPNKKIYFLLYKKDFDLLWAIKPFSHIIPLYMKGAIKEIEDVLKNQNGLHCDSASSELFHQGPFFQDSNELFVKLKEFWSKSANSVDFCTFELNSDCLEHLFGSIFFEETFIHDLILEWEDESNSKAIDYKGHRCFFYRLSNIVGKSYLLCFIGSQEASEDVFNGSFQVYIDQIHTFSKFMEEKDKLAHQASRDDVTGLYNQRQLSKDLHQAIKEHSEMEASFSLMFIDVDHFKRVNDLFGHITGSGMLIEMARMLKKILRSGDRIYRYGGDEYVVLMPKVDIKTVYKIALRVMETIKDHQFNVGKAKDYKLSVSIGIAQYPADAKSYEEIIEFADHMMYESKKSGRGKVFHLGEVNDDTLNSA